MENAHDAQTITHMPMKRRVRRKLDSLLNSGELTETGLQWLTMATDPFHDMPIMNSGYPDMSSTNSLVQVYNLQTTLVAPNGSGVWDAHIFFNPVSPPITMNASAGGGTGPDSVDNRLYRGVVNHTGNESGQLLTNYLYGGVNAISVDTGVDWSGAVGIQNNGRVSLPVKACGGAWRLIGAGFEVVNTTASLYKGGVVTSYRSPASQSQSHFKTPDFGQDGQKLHTTIVSLAPSTSAEAALYPTSRTWGAEEGCYIVAAINDSEITYNRPVAGRQAVCIEDSDVATLTTGLPTRLIYAPRYQDLIAGPVFTHGQNQALPFDVSGCVFSGLDSRTTLSVTARYIIERIPTVSEPDLLVLTRPPSSYDDLALTLYSKLMTELPVAVRVADNPAGEWWNIILDGLEAVIPAVGAALSGLTGGVSVPISAAATLGLAGIRKASDSYDNKNPSGVQVARRQRRVKKEPQPVLQQVGKQVVKAKALKQEAALLQSAAARASNAVRKRRRRNRNRK